MAFLNKREILFKFLVVGDFGVGKTSIIKRYTQGTFSPSSYKITIGADFAHKCVEYDENTRINLHLWDIAGHERYDSLTSVYYRYAVAAALIFDVTRIETFNSLEKWISDVREKCSLPCGTEIPLVLMANKADITMPPILNQMYKFCEKYRIEANYIISAKENINIDEAFQVLLDVAYRNYFQSQIKRSIQIKNNDTQQIRSRRCC